MSVFPEDEPLTTRGLYIHGASEPPSTQVESSEPRNVGHRELCWNRVVVLLLGLVAVGLLRGGYLGWQDYSKTSALSAAQIKAEDVCDAPPGMCTDAFHKKLDAINTGLSSAHSDIKKNVEEVQKYQEPMTDTCDKVSAMTVSCKGLDVAQDGCPVAIQEFALKSKLDPQRGVALQAQDGSFEKLRRTTSKSYGTIDKTLNDTANDVALQCSTASKSVQAACNGIYSIAPAAGKAVEKSFKLLQTDAADLVDAAKVSEAKKQKTKWYGLIEEEEKNLKVGKVEIKQRLAADKESNFASYKIETEAWMEKKITGDLVDADANYRDTVNEKVQQAAEDRQEAAKEIQKKANDILADAIARAEETNADKKKEDDAEMEEKINAMKTQMTDHLMGGYHKQIAKIKSDGMKASEKKLTEVVVKQKKELSDFSIKVKKEEMQKANDKKPEIAKKSLVDFQEAVSKTKAETTQQVKTDLAKYQTALKDGSFLGTAGVPMWDYMKLHLMSDKEKKNVLIKKYVEKEEIRMMKKAKQALIDFEQKAKDQKADSIRNGEQEVMEQAKKNAENRIEKKNEEHQQHLKSLYEEWEADTEAKVNEAQEKADKDVNEKVTEAEKKLRDKITKINEGTYDKHLDKTKSTFTDKRGKALKEGLKQVQKEEQQTVQQTVQKAKKIAKDEVNSAPSKWAAKAELRNADKKVELDDEFKKKLKEEIAALEESSAKRIENLKEVLAQSAVEMQVPVILASKVKESVISAGALCPKLGEVEQSCVQLLDNKNLIDVFVEKFTTFCQEAHVYEVSCQATYSWKRGWHISEEIVAPMQRIHGVVTAGSLWMERTADARETCKKQEDRRRLERNDDDKKMRRLEKKDVYVMQDVVGTCADLGKDLKDSRTSTEDDKLNALKSAKMDYDVQKDTAKQRLIQDDVAMRLKTSQEAAFNTVLKTRQDFKGLMATVSDRFDTMSMGCSDLVSTAKQPCAKLPSQWKLYDQVNSESEYFFKSFQGWMAKAEETCDKWKGNFIACVTRLHDRQGPIFKEETVAQPWRLEGMMQPVVRSIQLGLVLTCIFIYFACKDTNRLLTAAVCTSQAALIYLVIVSLVKGCMWVALGFVVLSLVSAHRYYKIQPRSRFVAMALKCAGTALEDTVGHKIWIAMIPVLILQACALLLSLGAALHLQRHSGWPLALALVLPLVAGVWTSEVIACIFRSAVGSAVSGVAVGGEQFANEVSTPLAALKQALAGPRGLGGIAVWAFFSALPFRTTSESAVDSIEIVLPEQGESDRSWWLRYAAAPDRSFSEALRSIRLTLALILSIVAVGARTGSIAIVAMTAIVMGHALVAVPVHSLEASLWGFAIAVEAVGAEQVKTNSTRELLKGIEPSSNIFERRRDIELMTDPAQYEASHYLLPQSESIAEDA